MYTLHPHPGKFEGNRSQLLSKVVYEWSRDGMCELIGNSETFGYYAYIEGKRYHYILSEDSQGFVDVDWGSPGTMAKKWQIIEEDWEQFNGQEEV